nr:response regulator [Desulfobulbaceae bacterium]
MPNKRILAIDDEPSIIYSIKKALSLLPYELHSASNGFEAINMLKHLVPDLILLDLSMPQMNGIEFLKAINLKPDDPYAVIILTGHGNDDEMRQCYELGAHFFFRKPFGITDLTCLVERCTRFKDLERESINYRHYLEESVENQNSYISKLSLALDSSSTSIIMTNDEFKVTYINRSYSTKSGFSLHDIQGEDISRLFASENRPQFADIKQQLLSGNAWKGELQSLSTNGRTFWVALSISPIKDPVSKITNFILIQDDISVLKEVEIEKKLLAQLAEQHRQDKLNFSNNMSHEFLTPIHIISTTATVLELKITDKSLHKYVDYIHKAVDDLTSSTIRILDLKRLNSQMLRPNLSEVSLKSLFNHITHSQMPKAAAKNLQLSYTLEENTPEQFITDEIFLVQIINYLVDNAIKFTESGQITITGTKDNEHNCLIVDITDSGIGIIDSKLQIIFESFSQADGSNSRPYNGLGLSLTLAQKLTEALGGKITVKSVINEGSCFSIILPLSPESFK